MIYISDRDQRSSTKVVRNTSDLANYRAFLELATLYASLSIDWDHTSVGSHKVEAERGVLHSTNTNTKHKGVWLVRHVFRWLPATIISHIHPLIPCQDGMLLV